jgi:pilus assembly protein Flp/PilA
MSAAASSGRISGVGSICGPSARDITLGETEMIETFEYIKIRLTAMAKTERGASAVEYGLLVALIAIIIIVAVSLLGNNLKGVFSKTAASVS